MKFRIVAFRITLETNKGPYGATALFEKGLNVIRAENTSGKSTLINGMLYALGLETLVGKRGPEAVKPVLYSAGEYAGDQFNVLESYVEIQIANGLGQEVTVRRYVKGDKDPGLIEVLHGPSLTHQEQNQYRAEPFFVGIEGAAQREQGFHYFLSNFLELNLPNVKRFKGKDVPLYIECIAPLMFIEQIRGWSGIQATLPQSFGIRNVAKVAVEYILNLDVIENEKRRIQISEEANRIRDDWKSLFDKMSQIAIDVGGKLVNVSPRPVTVLPDSPWIAISFNGEIVSLGDFLIAKRALLLKNSENDQPNTVGNIELEERLDSQENTLLVTEAELSRVRSEIYSEQNELGKLRNRSNSINSENQRNKDIKRLRNFGAEAGLSITQQNCPTCNQDVEDSLILTGAEVMDIDENIKFLKAEDEAIKMLISSGEHRLELLRSDKTTKSRYSSNLRLAIRDLRSDLLGTQNLSVATIREQLQFQEEIRQLEQLRDEFDELLGKLDECINQWKENRALESELPDDYFSTLDIEKLKHLSNNFDNKVRIFGYRSTGLSNLYISKDNYRPSCNEFEIAFGASASDNIRLIWAYTLSLLQVSEKHEGNHWGFLLFDEPEQQKMKEASSDSLYTEIAKMNQEKFQIILATSASKEVTRERLDGLPHQLLEFGEIVIRPIIN